MKIGRLIIVFFLIASLSACVKEVFPEKHGPELSLSYSGIEEGELGLFAQNPLSLKNLKGEALNGYCFFRDKLYWPANASEEPTTIVAYIPYSSTYDDQVFGQFDFDGTNCLWIAKCSAPYGQAEAALDFSPRCAKLQIYVDKTMEINQLSLKSVYRSVNVNFNNANSSVCGEKGDFVAVKTAENDDLACYEILLPAQDSQLILDIDGKYSAQSKSTVKLQEGKVYSNKTAIIESEQEQKLSFEEKNWADPDFSASLPTIGGVLFTSESRYGVYSLVGNNCTPLYCMGEGDQIAAYSSGNNKTYHQMNPAQGLYFGLTYSGSLSSGRSYNFTLGSMGLDLPTESTASVVKKDAQKVWISDSSKNLGFIISE